MRKRIVFGMLAACWLAGMPAGAGEAANRQLAIELAQEGEHHASAIEFRRLALSRTEPDASGSYYWLAGHQYAQGEEPRISEEMLDRAESLHPDLALPGSLVRGRNAQLRSNPAEAAFYYRSLLETDANEPARYAARRLAAFEVERGDSRKAERCLKKHAPDHSEGLAALEKYRAGRDKSPTLGGLLGIVPGLGHAYSGEYANGARCLILNSIFIYGMVHTASEDQWGAFAVIGFFEVTWYSGSIYGGIDAAHRYNRRRLEDCVGRIDGGAEYSPDWEMVPTIRLEFAF